jgi:hypothetical protein
MDVGIPHAGLAGAVRHGYRSRHPVCANRVEGITPDEIHWQSSRNSRVASGRRNRFSADRTGRCCAWGNWRILLLFRPGCLCSSGIIVAAIRKPARFSRQQNLREHRKHLVRFASFLVVSTSGGGLDLNLSGCSPLSAHQTDQTGVDALKIWHLAFSISLPLPVVASMGALP